MGDLGPKNFVYQKWPHHSPCCKFRFSHDGHFGLGGGSGGGGGSDGCRPFQCWPATALIRQPMSDAPPPFWGTGTWTWGGGGGCCLPRFCAFICAISLVLLRRLRPFACVHVLFLHAGVRHCALSTIFASAPHAATQAWYVHKEGSKT